MYMAKSDIANLLNFISSKRKSFFICVLFISLLIPFSKIYASGIWVGQSITCDASSAVIGLTSDISWSTDGGYLSLEGTGLYRTVKATQFWEGTATVTCSWKYRLYSSDKWRTQRKTWTFTCNENPVSIRPASMELGVGEKGQVSYSHSYSNSYLSAANVRYSSTNSFIAKVSSDGTVTALKEGTCYITVYSTLSNAANAPSCRVTVKDTKPSKVTLPSALSVCIDEFKTLSPIVTPSEAITSFSWWSDNERIATVNSSGRVRGISEGSTKIWVKTSNGGCVDFCNVNVQKPTFSVTGTTPRNNATNQSVLQKISITFSGLISPGTLYSEISLKDKYGNVIQGKCMTDGAVLSFIPDKALSPLETYTFAIPSSAVVDKYGSSNSAYTLSFTTGEMEKLMVKVNNMDNYVTKGSKVQLSANAQKAEVFYTTDGTVPTKNSNLYEEPISIEKETILKAKAFCDGYYDSDVFEHKYQISSLCIADAYPENNSVVSDFATLSIHYNHNISKGENFNDIKLKFRGEEVAGDMFISGKSLCFVPERKFEEGEYYLTIPQNSLVKSDDNEPCAKYVHSFNCDKGSPYPIAYGGRMCQYVIKSDHSFWVWGDYPLYEDLSWTFVKTPTVKAYNVVKATTNKSNIAVIKDGGDLYGWGKNQYGQLGLGHTNYMSTPAKVTNNVKCVAIGEYGAHTLILKNDGTVWSCGSNYSGELGNGERGTSANPNLYKVPIENVDTIAVHQWVSAALKKDGTLWTWGYGKYIGVGGSADITSPVKILSDVKSIAIDQNYGFAIKNDNSLWAWGNGDYIGAGDSKWQYLPVKILSDVRSVSVIATGGCAVKNDNTLWSWGYSQRIPEKIMDDVLQIRSSGFAIKTDRKLYSWGSNDYGTLGNGTKTNTFVSCDQAVCILDDVSKAISLVHAAGAMKNDGSVWTWGTNDNYALGYDNKEMVQLYPKILFEGRKAKPVCQAGFLQGKLVSSVGSKLLTHLILDPFNAHYTNIYYTSDDASIATVDECGVVNCLKKGKTKINARVSDEENNQFTASCELEVKDETNGVEDLIDSMPVEIVDIYDLGGRKLKKPIKGINIIRMSNGVTKKIIF